MSEQFEKNILLERMQSGFSAFERLLASLDEQQLTTPGVNGTWSVKDNLAHLSAWHRRTINLLDAALQGVELPDPTPDMTEEEINEQFYQQNKSRALSEIQAEFRDTYQQLVGLVKKISHKDLNKPLSWLNGRPVGLYVPGNTFEHYEEHTHIIKAWLEKNSNATASE